MAPGRTPAWCACPAATARQALQPARPHAPAHPAPENRHDESCCDPDGVLHPARRQSARCTRPAGAGRQRRCRAGRAARILLRDGPQGHRQARPARSTGRGPYPALSGQRGTRTADVDCGGHLAAGGHHTRPRAQHHPAVRAAIARRPLLARGPLGVLRPALSRAVPRPRQRGCRPAARAQRVHPHHRPGALGAVAARPRRGKPGVCAGARTGRCARKRAAHLGPQHAGGPLGHRARPAGPTGGRGVGCGGPAAPARHSPAVARLVAPRPVKIPQQRTLFRRWRGAWRRWSLWTLLVALVISMLAAMVWLAGRYEASQVQSRLERDTADAVSDIRVALTRNLQSLQALHAGDPGQLAWEVDAAELLRNRRELVRIEWRDAALRVRTHAQSPYRPVAWDARLREGNQSDAAIACANARRLSSPAYSSSYFQPHGDGLGSEMMELCLPLSSGGRSTGFLVVTYSLQDVLINLVAHNLTRSQEASFTEADGTRLAVLGAARRGSRMFTATHLLDLPGSTLVLRMDTWHSAPSLFPNVLTALVTAMSIALVTVMVVLVRDNRRRLRAERDLADALAFRWAIA